MIEQLATLCFGFALIHTFIAPKILGLRHRFRRNSPGENLLHLLSEVEIVFGLWATILFFLWAGVNSLDLGAFDAQSPLEYLEKVNFSESVFVFVIMVLSSTKPILGVASGTMSRIANVLSFSPGRNLAITVLIIGPLLGSLITEPASMTVCCYLLWPLFKSKNLASKAKYLLLGLLFVNISIGGTLTSFAAPPVLVVSRPWEWTSLYMFTHFGWRAVLSIVISTLIITTVVRRELDLVVFEHHKTPGIPPWIVLIESLFIVSAVIASHHVVLLFAIFLFFLGFNRVIKEHGGELRLKESLLVGFFLAGLVTLGSLQEWWIRPLLTGIAEIELFTVALALTAITDNALLTYLGTLVPEFTDSQKYSLVSGAVCGGGLTVIANAPNPIGYALLKGGFGEGGISSSKLFLAAVIPTTVAALLFLV